MPDADKQYVVILADRRTSGTWGPFPTYAKAEEFAAFVTAEVDPAEVRTLSSPVGELLAWRKASEEWRGA